MEISKWNVSNVKTMYSMFRKSIFNGDISKWNVGKVTDMGYLFYHSIFNEDISKWNLGNVTNIQNMFDIKKYDRVIINRSWHLKH